MPINKDMFVNPNDSERIRCPIGGLMFVDMEYSVPGRVRNSITSLILRVRTTISSPTATSTTEISNNGFGFLASTAATGVFDAVFTPAGLGRALYDQIISKLISVQSNKVIYRRVDIRTSNAVNFITGPPSYSYGGAVQTVTINSTHRYKAGAITGTKTEDVKDHKALVILCYGAGGSNYIDKPSRFLVSGVTYESYSQAIEDNAVGALYEALSTGIKFESTTPRIDVTLFPVVKTVGEFREIQVLQVEGLSNVAGSKVNRIK